MEVDVSSSPGVSASDEITVVKIKREDHKSKKETNGPVYGIDRSDDDKKSGENCIADESNLNPVVAENSEEVSYKNKKKHSLVCENSDPGDPNKSGEHCMATETNPNSTAAKCSGEKVPCEKKKLRPGKKDREALWLNGQNKFMSGAAENGTNLPGGSIVNNCPNLEGGGVPNSCSELHGTKSNEGKQHNCNYADNVDGTDAASTLETACRSNSKSCSSKMLVSTDEVPVTENSAELGAAGSDDGPDLLGGATAESNTDFQSQKIKKNNRRKRQNSSDHNIQELSTVTSAFDTEYKATSGNCYPKETIVTGENAVTESGATLQCENKMKKRKNVSNKNPANEEVTFEEGSPKNKCTILPSSPITHAKETIPVSGLVTTENIKSGSFCTSDTLVPKKMVSPGKKKLLVLDINGLLADINMDYRYAEYADFKISGKLGMMFILYH
jgi:hypothetical protein